MGVCCAIGCTHRSDANKAGVTFHKFPLNPTVRMQWILAIRRANWMPGPYSRICSAHFAEEDIDRKPGLVKIKKNAVPTIFKGFPSYLQNKKHCSNPCVTSPQLPAPSTLSHSQVAQEEPSLKTVTMPTIITLGIEPHKNPCATSPKIPSPPTLPLTQVSHQELTLPTVSVPAVRTIDTEPLRNPSCITSQEVPTETIIDTDPLRNPSCITSQEVSAETIIDTEPLRNPSGITSQEVPAPSTLLHPQVSQQEPSLPTVVTPVIDKEPSIQLISIPSSVTKDPALPSLLTVVFNGRHISTQYVSSQPKAFYEWKCKQLIQRCENLQIKIETLQDGERKDKKIAERNASYATSQELPPPSTLPHPQVSHQEPILPTVTVPAVTAINFEPLRNPSCVTSEELPTPSKLPHSQVSEQEPTWLEVTVIDTEEEPSIQSLSAQSLPVTEDPESPVSVMYSREHTSTLDTSPPKAYYLWKYKQLTEKCNKLKKELKTLQQKKRRKDKKITNLSTMLLSELPNNNVI